MADEENDVIKEARALLAKATPWPWATTPGAFWICDVGNTGCGVWSTAYPPEGEPFPHAEQEADAALLARAPELLSRLCDEVEQLKSLNKVQQESIQEFQREQKTLREAAQEGLDTLQWLMAQPEKGALQHIPSSARSVVAQLHAALHPQPEETK